MMLLLLLLLLRTSLMRSLMGLVPARLMLPAACARCACRYQQT